MEDINPVDMINYEPKAPGLPHRRSAFTGTGAHGCVGADRRDAHC
jgi:hypothetical protein